MDSFNDGRWIIVYFYISFFFIPCWNYLYFWNIFVAISISIELRLHNSKIVKQSNTRYEYEIVWI